MPDNFYEELAYKFKNLPNLKPDNAKGKDDSFFKYSIGDNFVHKLNPSRYKFYIEFMKGLENPEVLKNMIYENKLIGLRKEEEKQIINEITSKMNQLYSLPYNLDKNIVKNDELYTKLKKELYEKESNKLKNRIKNIVHTYDIGKIDGTRKRRKEKVAEKNTKNSEKIDEIIDETFGSTVKSTNVSGGGANQQNEIEQQFQQQYQQDFFPELPQEIKIGDNDTKISAINVINQNIKNTEEKIKKAQDKIDNDKIIYKENIQKIKDKFKSDGLLHNYTDRLKFVLETPTSDNSLKASKLQDIVLDIDENEFTSIKNLQLSKEDKLVFIAITFLLRLISLVIIDWSLNSNFIVSFKQAYVLYIVIYCIFLLLIVVMVNMTYNYPIYKLYLDSHNIFTSIASAMYFFYIVPGYTISNSIRLIVHIGIIIILTFTTIIITELDNKKNDSEEVLLYDYTIKKKIRSNLNNFTLILWLFTSLVAMNSN